jgi:predicted acylesterase/phospholipase RssA
MVVSKAVHMSSCVPLFFKSVKYNGKYYVDGAVINNLPILSFPNLRTLFLRFVDNNDKCVECKHDDKYKINNIIDFMYSIIQTSINQTNKLNVENGLLKLEKNNVSFVNIDTLNIDFLDFNMDEPTKKMLIERGEIGVKDMINNLYFK